MLTIPEALKSVIWQDEDGSFYLNIYFNEREGCTEDGGEAKYTRAFDCLEDMTVEEMIRSVIVEDECGQCALNVLANICSTCDEIAEQLQGPL
jgi:hypothetical protein